MQKKLRNLDTPGYSTGIYAGEGLAVNDIVMVAMHMTLLAAYVGERFGGGGRLPTNYN